MHRVRGIELDDSPKERMAVFQLPRNAPAMVSVVARTTASSWNGAFAQQEHALDVG